MEGTRVEHPRTTLVEIPARGPAESIRYAGHVGSIHIYDELLIARVLVVSALEDETLAIWREVGFRILPAKRELINPREELLARLWLSLHCWGVRALAGKERQD
jgi:hypothetical protein